MYQTFSTNSATETEGLALQLLPEILKHRIVLLSGELGSGKTTFVKGLAKALRIESLVKSPTYTYMNSYALPGGHSEFDHLLHFDLYRLPETSDDSHQTSASIGLEDALNTAKAVVVIEWPERLPIMITHLKIEFKKQANNHQILCYTPEAFSP